MSDEGDIKCRYCDHIRSQHTISTNAACDLCDCSGFEPTNVAAGEWIQPIENGYEMKCCDCDLVHILNFRIHEGRIQFQAFRAKES